VQDFLANTWQQKMPEFREAVDYMVRWMPPTKPKNIRHASYVWKDAVPAVEYWPYNTPRLHSTFKDRVITVSNYAYSLVLDWDQFDEEDDQLTDMQTHVQTSILRYGQLAIRRASEYLTGVPSLNPELVLAWDGVGLFSTVDGDGANRFSAVNGNLLAGSGLTPAAIINDIGVAQRQFLRYKDPAGQPLYDESDVDYNKLRCVIPVDLNQAFQKSSDQKDIRSDPLSNTAESNYIQGKFKYTINSYLTAATEWYICVDHPVYKPFVYRAPGDEKGAIRSIIADMNNSDRSRETNINGTYTDIRTALSPYFPASIIKFTN